MTDSVAPVNLPVIEGMIVVSPLADRYALKINQDGSINVTGSSAGNPSVGTNGATAPTSSTEVGFIDGSGNLAGVSATNPLPISGSFSASFTEPVLNIVGTATSAAVLSNFPVNPTTGYRTAAVQVTVLTAGNTLICEESNDGTTWFGIQTVGDTTVQSATPMTAIGKYIFPISAIRFRVRQSVFSSGTGSVNCELRQDLTSYAGAAVAIQGTVSVSGTVAVSNLPTTVDTNSGAAGASTLRVITATNSPVQLQASTAIAGKFGIDQTTPGTTNGVQVNAALPAGTNLLGGVELVDAAGTNKAAISAAGAVKVDGSAVTQPISGTVTANAGTNLNTSALALESGGNLATLAGAVSAGVEQTNLKQVNGVTTLAGAGAVGTGSQRVAVGQDTTTIAGSAPGTAGTPSANVVSVQGESGMVPMAVLPDTSSFQSGTASTTGATSVSLIAAVASKRIYVTSFSFSNSSATAVTISLQDGSGGTTLLTIEVPAGGGNNLGSTLPLCRTTAGNALFFQASGSATTIYANAAGFAQ